MFSKRFKELRKERKLSQAKVAEDLNMSQATIASWEAGSRMPLTDMIPQIADYFQVTTDYLLDVPESEQHDNLTIQTEEAKILAAGIDKLPEKQRKMALNVVKTIFAQYSEYFEKGTSEE